MVPLFLGGIPKTGSRHKIHGTVISNIISFKWRCQGIIPPKLYPEKFGCNDIGGTS